MLEDRKQVRMNIQKAIKKKKDFQIEYRIQTSEGYLKWIWEQGNAVPSESGDVILEGFITDITEKKLHALQMQSLILIGSALHRAEQYRDFFKDSFKEIKKLYETKNIAVLLKSSKEGFMQMIAGTGEWEYFIDKELDIKECPSYQTLRDGEIVLHDREQPLKKLFRALENQSDRYVLFIPLRIHNKTSGLIAAGREYKFTQLELSVFRAIADMVTAAIERILLYKKTTKQLKRLESLHAIDQAITSIYDINVVNKIILDQVCRELGADAANILILNQATNMLEYFGICGFVDQKIKNNRVPLTTSVAGKVVLENIKYFTPNLDENPLSFIRRNMPVENFKAYFASPLTIRGQVIGVMELFFRDVYYPDEDWQNFFDAIATQAAVAYDSSRKILKYAEYSAKSGIFL